MIKSASQSTKSLVKTLTLNVNNLFWLCIIIAIIGYNLPWIVSKGASLTYGAYDLAEWSSLNPSVRSSSLLLTSLLLRLPPLCLALAIGFRAHKFFSINALLIIIITITLLPPLEFFTQFRDDPNHRQQFYIAVATLIGGALGLSGLLRGRQWLGTAFSSFLGISVSVIGLIQTYNLMRGFNLPVQIGIGMFTIVAALLGILVLAIIDQVQDSL